MENINFKSPEDARTRSRSPNRRAFLQNASGAALMVMAAGCRSLRSAQTSGQGPAIGLGEGDVGIMNYALALEGLEAAFYTLVMSHPYPGMTPQEQRVLAEIRDHEIVHREFFRRALGSAAIPPLRYNFSRINFNSRKEVLHASAMFEDVGVSAYNGAGKFIGAPQNLALAGKIVSVEARHATAIRNLIVPGSSAAFDEGALDVSRSPAQVLTIVDPFIVTKISGAGWKERPVRSESI